MQIKGEGVSGRVTLINWKGCCSQEVRRQHGRGWQGWSPTILWAVCPHRCWYLQCSSVVLRSWKSRIISIPLLCTLLELMPALLLGHSILPLSCLRAATKQSRDIVNFNWKWTAPLFEMNNLNRFQWSTMQKQTHL